VEPLRTHLDFETRSLVDLPKLGEHAYARDPSTAPLMLTYGTAPKGVRPDFKLIDFFEVSGYAGAVYPHTKQPEWQIFRVPCPPEILLAVARGDTFVAHNARFEQAIYYYICHRKWGWPLPVRWSCTAARARYFGLRASLAGAASDLEVITQKDERGKEYINTFCKPRKYHGKKADGIVRQLWAEPWEAPDDWIGFKEYCMTDGLAEADVDAVLPDLPNFEQRVWEWDFKINTRGVPIDIPSVARAQEFSDHFTTQANKRFEQLTALRPTQRDRVLEYLQQREEIETLGDLKSKTLKRLVMADFPTDLQDVISIRLDCSLASTKKLATMLRTTDTDGMARGVHLYGGAHTMRWSSKRIQVQNMKRGDAKEQARLMAFLAHPSWSAPAVGMGHNGGPSLDETPPQPEWAVEAGWRFMRPLAALSQSMRGFVAAPEGQCLRAADFAQIEARVLSWLARAERKLDAFRNKQDLYVKFASVMYGREYDEYFEYVNGKRKVKQPLAFERQVAKSAELGCGFGLGGTKFQEYCDNSDIIIDLETAKFTVDRWREDNPEIVALWARVEQAAILATDNPGEEYGLRGTNVTFKVWHIDSERYWLVCRLPSGRAIHYYRPKVELRVKWGRPKETLTFRTEWNAKSYREDTYGGKLVENIVQAVARDVLCVGGMNADDAGYDVVMLVHDETVTLVDRDFGSHQELCTLMCQQHEWVTDLPIEAEGATMERYGK
jgi:DNA polymerase